MKEPMVHGHARSRQPRLARWARAAWLLALATLPAWSVAAVSLRDDRGTVLMLPTPPRRIVTLLPSLTESVCALGGCARLVGTDRFSNSPAEVSALPKLGGLEDAQVERIVALRPDVVLAPPSSRAVARLEDLGVRVLVIGSSTHADVRRSLGTLAQLLGVPDRAAQVWMRIEREIEVASSRIPARVRGQRVYFEIDSAPYAAGAGSFVGETLARLGMGNIAAPQLGPFPKLNPEFVVRAQPDIVLAQRRNFDEMPRRPGWEAVRAVRARRGCGFEMARYELLIRPGPRMGEAAQVLADCLAALETR